MAAKKKSKKPPKMCGCVSKIDKLLATQNITLDTVCTISNGRVYPQISVLKVNPKGEKARKLVPIYCPFCGKKYPR